MKMNILSTLRLALLFYCVTELYFVGRLNANVSINIQTTEIGQCQWLTENNSLDEIVKFACSKNKPILLLFSSTKCPPCMYIKKHILAKDNFKSVEYSAILVYIDIDKHKGKELEQKYSIPGLPWVILLSPTGRIIEDIRYLRFEDYLPSRLSKWIENNVSGNGTRELKQRLKNNPADREALIHMCDMDIMEDCSISKIEYLRKAIRINANYQDITCQKAMEKLVLALLYEYDSVNKVERYAFVANGDSLIMELCEHFYPNNFRFDMKGNIGYEVLIRWFSKTQRQEKAIAVYNDFMIDECDFVRDYRIHLLMPKIFLKCGDKISAENIRQKYETIINHNRQLLKSIYFVSYYYAMTMEICEMLGNRDINSNSWIIFRNNMFYYRDSSLFRKISEWDNWERLSFDERIIELALKCGFNQNAALWICENGINAWTEKKERERYHNWRLKILESTNSQ